MILIAGLITSAVLAILAWSIVDQKILERELREREARLRAMFECSRDAIGVSKKGIHIYANPSYLRMFGFENNQAIVGTRIIDSIAPGSRGKVIENVERRAAGEHVPTFYETRGLRVDGSEFEAECNVSTYEFSGEIHSVAMIRDISDRRRAEESLRESETRFRQLSEAAIEGIAVTENGILIDGNGRLAAMLGYELGEMIGRPIIEFVAPTSRETVLRHIAEDYQDGFEHLLLRRDGSTFYAETHARTVIWGGKATRVTALLDVSDRRRAEEQLHKLSLAVEQSPVSIVITDTAGRIEYVNPRFTKVTGYTREEVSGNNPRILKSGETPPEEYRGLWDTITAGREWHGEFHNRRKNGELFWEFASISPVKNKEGLITNFLAVKEDITERKRGEEALRQAQKLNSIGTLAGGIAHDFNNVLGGIIGYTDMSLRYAAKGSVLESNLLKVLKVSGRAKQLIQQILTFSRKANAYRSVISVRPVVEEVVELLKASIPSSVIIETDVSARTKPVLADPTKIHEAVVNLSTNAVHAMDRKGTLSIRLYGESLDRVVYGQCGEISPGEYTVLEVRDTGCGMDPVTLSKAFEPFFTTKGVGEGTGMGLSVVLGVVQSIGGDILVETTQGKGTSFRLFLPVTDEPASGAAREIVPIPFSGTEQVLFVDDEQMLVETAKDLLARLGYGVTGTSNSLDALRSLRENCRAYDILITDQTMPGMSGMELAREARAIRKDLPVILCTGFSDDLDQKKTSALGISRVVMKPYRYNEIAEVIRNVIDG